MNSIEIVQRSSAWDERYSLPTVPEHNNPFTYMAIIEKVMREYDGNTVDPDRLKKFASECEKQDGLFDRWPDGSDLTSHDELIGMGSLSPNLAVKVWLYLERSGGDYNNTDEESPRPLRFNQSRFIQLLPFLETSAGFKSSLLNRIGWVSALLHDAFTADHSGGERLLQWLQFDVMKIYPEAYFAIAFWKYRMKCKGITLKKSVENELQIKEITDLAGEW